MADPLISTSFAAGELTAALNGRVDLVKYRTGAAVMRNFFVDYRGGASTRAGTQYAGSSRLVAERPAPRVIPFVFSSTEAYALELNGSTMRIVFDGAYVTETGVNVTAGNNGLILTVTAPGNPYAIGDAVRVDGITGLARPNGISGVNGRTFQVMGVGAGVVALGAIDETNDYVVIDATTWTPYVSGGTIRRIYEIATPWNGFVLFELNFVQSADVLTVVHPDFPAYDIRRTSLTAWSIVQQTYGAAVGPPVSVSFAPINNDLSDPQYYIVYVLTTVDATGRESTPSGNVIMSNRALDQVTEPNVSNALGWLGVVNAYKYRIYAALPVPIGLLGAGPYVVGLLGESFDGSFLDVNYAPDFSVAPPQARNPFLNTGIAAATIVNSGSGYVSPSLTIVDGTGSGGYVALSSDTSLTAAPYGGLVVANILSGGTGYSAPTAVITDVAPLGSGLVLAFSGAWVANPLGTGFMPAPGSITITNGGSNYHHNSYSNFIIGTASAQVGANVLQIDITSVVGGVVQTISWANTDVSPVPTTGMSSTNASTIAFAYGTDTTGSGAVVQLTIGGGDNPSCVAYLQQRLVFAGSRNKPSTLWMSRPGQFTSFDVSDPVQDDDAITAALYAQEVNIINALVVVNGGLMALTSGGAYFISGGASDAAITPTTVRAPAQAFSGALPLAPVRIGDSVLYSQARGTGVRNLEFNFYSNAFTGADVSVLSGHLLEGRRIVQWAYAEEPMKVLWCVRDDGILLSLTYLKEQEVYGWARHDTQGEVVSVCSVPEGREDAVYLVVNRYVPGAGGFVYMVERMASRLFGANPAATIAAQPEKSWCVDGGAQYPLTTPDTDIMFGEDQGLGILYSVEIVSPGSGYTAPIVQIDDVSGLDGAITLSITGGQVTGATVTNAGSGYVSPTLDVRDPTGVGAVVFVRVVNKVRFLFGANAFSGADVGKVLRVRGGKGPIIEVPTPNVLIADMQVLPAGLANMTGLILPKVMAGEWSLTAEVSTIGGLDHLNGSTVQVLCDGNVNDPQVVVDGCITLDRPASCIIAGQGFTCQLQTMRLETAQQPTSQGRRKEIAYTVLRMKDARGMRAGPSWDRLSEIKDRTSSDAMGLELPFQEGGGTLEPDYEGAPTAPRPLTYLDKSFISAPQWSPEGIVCMQQSYPLPATILAVIPWVENGDNL